MITICDDANDDGGGDGKGKGIVTPPQKKRKDGEGEHCDGEQTLKQTWDIYIIL